MALTQILILLKRRVYNIWPFQQKEIFRQETQKDFAARRRESFSRLLELQVLQWQRYFFDHTLPSKLSQSGMYVCAWERSACQVHCQEFYLLRSRQTDTENMKHNAQWTEVKQNRLYIFLAQKKGTQWHTNLMSKYKVLVGQEKNVCRRSRRGSLQLRNLFFVESEV